MLGSAKEHWCIWINGEIWWDLWEKFWDECQKLNLGYENM